MVSFRFRGLHPLAYRQPNIFACIIVLLYSTEYLRSHNFSFFIIGNWYHFQDNTKSFFEMWPTILKQYRSFKLFRVNSIYNRNFYVIYLIALWLALEIVLTEVKQKLFHYFIHFIVFLCLFLAYFCLHAPQKSITTIQLATVMREDHQRSNCLNRRFPCQNQKPPEWVLVGIPTKRTIPKMMPRLFWTFIIFSQCLKAVS